MPDLPWRFAESGDKCRALIAGDLAVLGFPWRWQSYEWRRALRYGVLETGALLQTEYCGAMPQEFITGIGIGDDPPSGAETPECVLLVRGWFDDAAAH